MQLSKHANEEILKLKRSVLGEVGSTSAAAGDPNFPEDSIEEINSHTPPVHLSKE